jgi:hypothetical protein
MITADGAERKHLPHHKRNGDVFVWSPQRIAYARNTA